MPQLREKVVPLMRNVEMNLVGDELVIVCGLASAVAPGRPDILASTMGNVSLPGRPDLRISLLVFTKGRASS